MDRIETAEYYLSRFSELAPARTLKKVNPSNDGMGFIVRYLYRQGDKVVYAGDLAKASCVSTARIAAALNNLETQGLVERCTAEEDSRKTVVRLTALGLERAEGMKQMLLEQFASLIEEVGTGDMDEFIRISQKMKNAMERMKEEEEQDV